MILIINLNKYKLHDLEFLKPLTGLIPNSRVVHYKKLRAKDVVSAKKIIIAGTSLKDEDYLDSLEEFFWIKNYNKPLLGICAGMQILGLVHGAKLKKSQEIGQTSIKITKKDPLIGDIYKVYSLHQFSISLPKGFTTLAKSSKTLQVIKKKNHYGLLFHPEVLNKEIVQKFIR